MNFVKCNDCKNIVLHGDVVTCTKALIDVRVMGIAKHVDVYAECSQFDRQPMPVPELPITEPAKRGRPAKC